MTLLILKDTVGLHVKYSFESAICHGASAIRDGRLWSSYWQRLALVLRYLAAQTGDSFQLIVLLNVRL